MDYGGPALTPGMIYQFRVLLGATYEFDLSSGPKLPAKGEKPRKPKAPKRRR